MFRPLSAPVFITAFISMPGMPQHAQAQHISLAAHRAVYELTLDPKKAGTQIATARGRIVYEITGNACDGYSVHLRQVMELDTAEGKQTTNDLRSTTWEDGAAKSFRFKNQSYVDRELRDEADGTAERAKDGGLSVRLAKPKGGPLKFDGPILLPSEQIVKIIEAGKKGEHLLEAKVFDGSPNGKRFYETLSVIGSGRRGDDAEIEQAARVPRLASIERFPVIVSYFDAKGTGEQTPAYTFGFDLYENGVSRALKLDYGKFALKGELKSVKFFKPTPCKE